MSHLAAIAEIDKLARQVGLDPAVLQPLAALPYRQLREIRQCLGERLFCIDEPVFKRLARLANRIPAPLLHWLATHRLGPVITARVAGLMAARHALPAARRMSPDFLASVSVHLDPRYARDIISQLPTGQIVAIVHVLIEWGEYITMGRFVDFLSDTTIQAVIDAVPEESHLVRIAYYMESKNRLDHVIRMLPRERQRKAILLAAEPENGLMLQVMALVFHVSYALQHELGELAAEQDERVLNEIVQATQRHDLWSDLLPVVALLSEESCRKVVNLPVLRDDPAVLQSILAAADREGLWRTVLPLILLMNDAMRQAVADIATTLTTPALRRVADAALLAEQWQPVAEIVARMPAGKQRQFGGILREYGQVDPALLQRLGDLAEEHGFGRYVAAGQT